MNIRTLLRDQKNIDYYSFDRLRTIYPRLNRVNSSFRARKAELSHYIVDNNEVRVVEFFKDGRIDFYPMASSYHGQSVSSLYNFLTNRYVGFSQWNGRHYKVYHNGSSFRCSCNMVSILPNKSLWFSDKEKVLCVPPYGVNDKLYMSRILNWKVKELEKNQEFGSNNVIAAHKCEGYRGWNGTVDDKCFRCGEEITESIRVAAGIMRL